MLSKSTTARRYPYQMSEINLKDAIICSAITNVTLAIEYIQAAMIRRTRLIPKQNESLTDPTLPWSSQAGLNCINHYVYAKVLLVHHGRITLCRN